MTVSMVAPEARAASTSGCTRSARATTTATSLGFLELLAQPLQATTNGAPLPNVISVSYGVCESTVSPYTASRTLVERQLTATAALGITTVVAAGDTGSSACARGVPPNQLTSSDKKPQVSWPATLAVGAGRRRHEPHAQRRQQRSPRPAPGTTPPTRPRSRRRRAAAAGSSTFEKRARGGSPRSRSRARSTAWCPTSPRSPTRARATRSSAPAASRAAPARARASPSSAARAPRRRSSPGMIALWTQQARNQGLPRPGFVAPLLYALAQHNPQAFIDITQGTNALFGGSCCPPGPASTSPRAGDRRWPTPWPACSARAGEGGVLPRRSTRTPHCGAPPRARGSKPDPVPHHPQRGGFDHVAPSALRSARRRRTEPMIR